MGNVLSQDASRQAGAVAELSGGEGLARLRRYAETLRTDGLDQAQFEEFISLARQEAKARPGPELARFVDELLEDDRLRHVVIAGQVRVRARLLEVQQLLGFPWALQIAPEDLVLIAAAPTHGGFRGVTGFVAVLSACFNAVFLAATLRETPLALFFFTGLAPAIATLFAAYSFSSRRLLRTLGWLWLLGPAFTAWALRWFSSGDAASVALVGMGFAFPSMLTAWLALGLSGKAPE